MSYSFLPDLPTETPDTWRVCDGFHPTIYGAYRTGWLPAAAISTATGAATPKFGYGFCYQVAAGGNAQVVLPFAKSGGSGATNTTYVWDGSAWANRDGASSALGTCFAQVGNITLVGTPTAGIVQRDATGVANFAAVASSPTNVGVLMVNALNIVMALSTNSDAYATSDTSAPTLWTGGEASSGNVRLTSGNFTAGAPMGDDFICFKERGVYRATYEGGQVKWRFRLIDAEKGAWAPGCAVFGGGRIYFIGRNGVWSFDGANFERLDYGIWQTILGVCGASTAFGRVYTQTKMVWDSVTQNIFVFAQTQYSSNTDGRNSSANSFLSYNTLSKKWGKQTQLSETGSGDFIQAVFEVSSLNGYPTAWASETDGKRLFNTDVGFFSSTNDKVEVLTTSFNPTDLPGTNYKPNLRTSRLGVRDRMTYVERFIPHWTLSDGIGTDLSTATVKTATHYYSDSVFESNTTGDTVTLTTDQYWADLRKDARWHNVELKLNCEAVIDGGTWVAKQTGKN